MVCLKISTRFDPKAKSVLRKIQKGQTLAELEDEWLDDNELDDRRPPEDEIEPSCPKNLISLMKQCWADSPKDRLGSTQIASKLTSIVKKLRRASTDITEQRTSKCASLLAYGIAIDMVCADSVFTDGERDLLEQKRIELGITEEEHRSEFAHRLEGLSAATAVDAQSQQLSVSDVLKCAKARIITSQRLYRALGYIMPNRMITMIHCDMMLSDRVGRAGPIIQNDGPAAGGKDQTSRDHESNV